jgi:tetratricopeptide (TPR) repeat protein
MLGLLYNEQNKQKKSIDYLAKACDKQPLIVRAYYNYALKLQQIKEFAKADAIINKALKKIPTDESLLYVKLLGVVILDKTPEAIDICNKLLKISPDNQNYRRIMNSLKEKT